LTVHPFTLGLQGPFAIKFCKLLLTNVHRLMLPFLLGAPVVGRTSCHSFAWAGGVISTQDAANFSLGRPQWAEARRTSRSYLCPPEGYSQSSWRASPVIGVRGKPPMSAASGMALIEGGPGDSLVPF